MKLSKFSILTACLLLLPLSVIAHGLRTPIINDANAVAAKGDIPTPEKYLSAIKSYQDEVAQELKTTQQYVQNIVVATQNGQQQIAQQNYVLAHQSYERIRIIAKLFGKADQSLNSRADYYIRGVNDPSFTGFHLLEYDLFARNDLREAHTEAVNLQYKLADLQKRVIADDVDIAKIIQSAADFLEISLSTKLLGKENQYSHSDLADIQANILGSAQIIRHLSSFISVDQRSDLNNGYQQILTILKKYQLPLGQFEMFDRLSQEDHDQLYSLISTQIKRLVQLRSELKIQVYYKYKH